MHIEFFKQQQKVLRGVVSRTLITTCMHAHTPIAAHTHTHTHTQNERDLLRRPLSTVRHGTASSSSSIPVCVLTARHQTTLLALVVVPHLLPLLLPLLIRLVVDFLLSLVKGFQPLLRWTG